MSRVSQLKQYAGKPLKAGDELIEKSNTSDFDAPRVGKPYKCGPGLACLVPRGADAWRQPLVEEVHHPAADGAVPHHERAGWVPGVCHRRPIVDRWTHSRAQLYNGSDYPQRVTIFYLAYIQR